MAHKNKQNRSPWKDRQKYSSKTVQKNLKGKHKRPEEAFSFNEADDRIYDILRNHGFSQLAHEKRQLLTKYYFLLIENQKVNNFTRLIKLRDIAIKHFIDSMLPSELFDLKTPLLDIGTGPGLPGIPIKVLNPEKRIILAEGVQTRVEFLKHCRDQLELKELDIIGKYIDESFVYPVKGIITRAVEDIQNTLNKSGNCLQVGGHVYLMKGPNVDPEIKDAKRNCSEYFSLVKDIGYEIPKTPHKRRLLVYEKIKSKPLPKELFES